jgi:hypothetical protein
MTKTEKKLKAEENARKAEANQKIEYAKAFDRRITKSPR